MPYTVRVEVPFIEKSGKTAYTSFWLKAELLDDHSNMGAIMTDVGQLENRLAELSMAAVGSSRVIVESGRVPAAPNEAALVNTYAFMRLVDEAADNEPGSYRVYAPDMFLYDADESGLLGTVFTELWRIQIDPLVAHPKTGADATLKYAQVRYKRQTQNLD